MELMWDTRRGGWDFFTPWVGVISNTEGKNKANDKYIPVIKSRFRYPKWFTKELINEIKSTMLVHKRYKTTCHLQHQ